MNQLAYSIADIPGATPNLCVMSFKTLGKIQVQLQTERRYTEDSIKGSGISVFYKMPTINGPTGPMALLGSSNWDENLIGVLTKESWVIASPGNKPFVPDTASGDPIVDVPGTGNAGAFYRASAIVYCKAPGFNGMITLS
jgi:hypothetical protein